MTKPSPALLPLPQRITTGPWMPIRCSTSTQPRPAFSMSTRPEMPSSSIARRSISRDWARERAIQVTPSSCRAYIPPASASVWFVVLSLRERNTSRGARRLQSPLVRFAAEVDDDRLVERQVLGHVLAVLLDEIEILAAVAFDLAAGFFLLRGDGGIDQPASALEKRLAADLSAVERGNVF